MFVLAQHTGRLCRFSSNITLKNRKKHPNIKVKFMYLYLFLILYFQIGKETEKHLVPLNVALGQFKVHGHHLVVCLRPGSLSSDQLIFCNLPFFPHWEQEKNVDIWFIITKKICSVTLSLLFFWWFVINVVTLTM